LWMWSTKSQQLNSPPSTGWSAPRCCAPSSRQSDSASAAGRSRRRARSGTHAGMPDFTRLVSPVVRRRGERPDPQHGAHLQPAAAGVAHQGAQARQVPAWTMELSAPGKGLVHCMDRAEYEPRPLQGSSTGTCASSQRDDPLQPAGRRGLRPRRDDPQPGVDALRHRAIPRLLRHGHGLGGRFERWPPLSCTISSWARVWQVAQTRRGFPGLDELRTGERAPPLPSGAVERRSHYNPHPGHLTRGPRCRGPRCMLHRSGHQDVRLELRSACGRS
jgi:hypothetical protein